MNHFEYNECNRIFIFFREKKDREKEDKEKSKIVLLRKQKGDLEKKEKFFLQALDTGKNRCGHRVVNLVGFV